MGLRDQIRNHVDKAILNTNHFAQEITYTPDGGSATTIRAIMVYDAGFGVQILDEGEEERKTAMARVKSSDVESPQRGETISDGTTTWSITGVTRGMDFMTTLNLIAIGDVLKSRRGRRETI
ncbi:hypothetical protein Pan216_20930 [Planctomycetes bacterium Pan216]|uniref:Uncharacterized protein n=1 Tax=Kolteria novifilia TaxID=2527975 RepID=A0A518B2M1_9BACT|nr:hypothetical protein Pan216_20930 [Planctomycetes bacterium Pan216]